MCSSVRQIVLKYKILDAKRCEPSDAQISIMRDHNVDEWFYGFCEQVRYLFPKAHIAQMIRYYAYLI